MIYIPFALQQLENITADNIGDFSGMDEGSNIASMNNNKFNVDEEDDSTVAEPGRVSYNIRGINVVRNLPFTLFCNNLIMDFGMKY